MVPCQPTQGYSSSHGHSGGGTLASFDQVLPVAKKALHDPLPEAGELDESFDIARAERVSADGGARSRLKFRVKLNLQRVTDHDQLRRKRRRRRRAVEEEEEQLVWMGLVMLPIQ
ncbi:unnamed protein product [Pleuronectes platessa]|uniref:Uncharacterized protein n=1 Tax=Pleuronectes platessa TaxID=8262 RepID=A0A9N7VTF9_PLEPL|nr:unnamed protein product [Pleuronectes platessa]